MSHATPYDASCFPTTSPDALRQRAQLLRRCRDYFDQRGFVEVQTPILSQDIVIDRHLDPILVPFPREVPRHAEHSHRFLQTSPEQNMKRLLLSGLEAIYQIGPVFREGEFGQHHNPEFTMMEWYRVGDDMDQGIALLANLIEETLGTSASEISTYQQVFLELLAIDPLEADERQLANLALQHGWVADSQWSTDRDDWLNLLFSFGVQPKLGWEQPRVVKYFPASQAALAKETPHDARTAERFEIFYRGVELANGFHELLDATVLEARNQIANRQRREEGRLALPEQNRLLDAMRVGLPRCTGCALGFDRLAMLAIGATALQDVLCFPWDRA